MSQTLKDALTRGLLLAFIAAGVAFFGELGRGNSYEDAFIAAGIAFFGLLAVRFLGEGFYDHRRDTKAAKEVAGEPTSTLPMN
jgi:hypothetical protein